MDDIKRIRQFIVLYLQLQPKPADAQIHSLAAALGCDKETLESIIYRMLAQTSEVQTAAVRRLRATADIEDVLTDKIADDDVPMDDAGTNDGLSDADIDDGMQQETMDDGTDTEDVGIGVDSGDTRDVLTDDGVAIVEASTPGYVTFTDKKGHAYRVLNRNGRPMNVAVVGYYPHHPKTALSDEVLAKWDVVAIGKSLKDIDKVVKHHVKQFGVTQLEVVDLTK